ncbi:MAG: hypothetical protein AB7R40_23535 [Nitrospiraceae bacterium]
MSDHLAKEAARLKADELFNKALDNIRSEALNGLAAVDADSYHAVVRLQQKVAVVDEIRATLDRYILAAPQPQEENSPYA